MGSPPHGRGKGQDTLYVRDRYRITPAWAGKRSWAAAVARGHPDHPRMGGEKAPAAGHCSTDTGSPPRRRGKVRICFCFGEKLRITPAWAGKSCGWASCGGLSWDHPRMGGEKMTRRYSSVPVPGSPPRGRGKGAGEPLRLLDGGITPAWAGKSCQPDCRTSRTWDHPRMGGEKPLRAYAPPGR